MTPQEIYEYKQRWMSTNTHPVTLDEYLEFDGKSWCRKNLESKVWKFSKYTDIYEHTFYFEKVEDAEAFRKKFKK